VYNRTYGQDTAFNQNRRICKIPSTGVLFTKFKKDWRSIKFKNGVINQKFYFIADNGQNIKIKVLETGDFNSVATVYPKTELYSRDSLAVFFISGGTIGNGEKI